jgi:glutamine amidotransferase
MIKASVIPFPLSNTRAVSELLIRCNISSLITDDADEIRKSNLLVLPGVGHFGSTLQFLREKRLDGLIHELARNNHNILGICVGMQVLGTKSEESPNELGIGFFDLEFVRARPRASLGWQFMDGIIPGYFFHNHAFVARPSLDLDKAFVDPQGFVSMVMRKKVVGVQFHPEKSQIYGVNLIKKLLSEFWCV